MQHELIKLKNNLDTLFIDSPGSTTASVQIWFRAGSALENKSNEGIAHFLEHMFFKGTPTRPGAAIAHEVESFGGEINAFTSFDYTCYYINTPNTKLSNTINILMDMVSNPEFKEEDIIPERGVVFEEYRRSQDNAGQYAFWQIQKNCFTSGYTHPILGNEETIKNFSQEQLKDFRAKHYNLSNALFVVAGDLTEKEKYIQSIESFQMPHGESSSFPPFKIKETGIVEVHQKETKMVQMNLCWQGSPYNAPQASAEDLAMNCFGYGESSPLHKELVLKDSLANGAGCSTMFMNNGGFHYMKAVFPMKNLDNVLKRLRETLETSFHHGFEKNELQKIKNQYIASKVFDKESLESFAFTLGHGFAQSGNPNSEDEFIERIRKSPLSQVNKSFAEILSGPCHVSVQIPMDEDIKKTHEKVRKFHESLKKKFKKRKSTQNTKYKEALSKYDPQVKLVTIKPGLKLLYRQNPVTPTFILHAYIQGGLTEENKKNNGIYQVLSGSLSKGYKGVTQEQLNIDLENKSASLNSFSGKNAYGLTAHAQSLHFEQIAKHFTGSLCSPSFKAKTVNHDKELTIRTILNHKENPIKACFQQVNEMLFHGHPYSLPIIGTETSIKSINAKMVSELHQKNLRNKEILITYCGDEELENVIEILTPLFDSIRSKKVKPFKIKKITPIKGQKKYVHFDREQTQIFYGIPGKHLSHKDNIPLKMLSSHLSGQSSELFVNVRDRLGLCYTAQPVHFTAHEGGYWGIYMASGHDKVEAAVKAIKAIIENIRDNGIDEKEFERIKNMIEGQNLLNVQTNEDYANIYSVTTHQGKKLDYYHLKNDVIKNYTYDEFKTALNKILSQKWSTVIVGRSDI